MQVRILIIRSCAVITLGLVALLSLPAEAELNIHITDGCAWCADACSEATQEDFCEIFSGSCQGPYTCEQVSCVNWGNNTQAVRIQCRSRQQ